jgi:hypothetical protein
MEDHHHEKKIDLNNELGMTRRDLLHRGAIVGGTLLWVAPAIQSLSPAASAQSSDVGSENFACCSCSGKTHAPDKCTNDGGPDGNPPADEPQFLSDQGCQDFCFDRGYTQFEYHAGPNPILCDTHFKCGVP